MNTAYRLAIELGTASLTVRDWRDHGSLGVTSDSEYDAGPTRHGAALDDDNRG